MNPDVFLNRSFPCDCGRTHKVAIEAIVYAPDAVEQLPSFFRDAPRGSTGFLLADKRTRRVAAEPVERQLRSAGYAVRVHVLADPPHGDPVCDDVTLETVEAALPREARFLVSVGSGVVSDLCKWVSTRSRIPYVAVATAASMNGYTSENIAPAIRGVKRVIPGVVPRAVLATPAVIRDAPFPLTAAGLGDVLAKPVSVTDWKINHLLFGEYYCPLCAQLIRDLEPTYLNRPEAVRQKDPAALEVLFRSLLYSGLSMTLAGTSFPASGGEHMVSHVLDMKAGAEGLAHDYHGRQVGLGAIFASALYERLLSLPTPRFEVVVEETDAAYWGSLAPVVEEEHARKRIRARQAVERLRRPGVWDSVKTVIRESARPAADIRRCLRDAGAAHRIEDIGCTRDRFLAALLHSHQIRERYTVLDLARATGVLPAKAEEILGRYLEN